MARPTLEYTRIDPFTLASGGTASIPMTGPSLGTKSAMTVLVSGTGATGGVSNVVTKTGSTTTALFTRIGHWNLSSQFASFWYAYNVPVAALSTLNIFGADAIYGGAEVGYWDAVDVDSLISSSAGSPGTIAGFLPPGYSSWGPGDLTVDDVAYGMIMGTPDTATWTLAGGPTMETIYPNHATTPPVFTNDQGVSVGAVTQAGAPKVCCGFVREVPAGGPLPWAFDFSATTTFRIYILRIRGTPSGVGVASQMVTILG